MLEYKIFDNDPNKEYVFLIHGIGGSANIFFPQIKSYRNHFNVVAVHLRGHKKSPSVLDVEDFSFKRAARDVVDVLDEIGIRKAHMVGISLGAVVAHQILAIAPNRVETAVLGGVITKITPLPKLLLLIGSMVKKFVPHMWLYTIFAHILMPRKNHQESRNSFIKEAAQMKRNEFLGWYDIAPTVRGTFTTAVEPAAHVPKLYMMGEGDHMFIDHVWEDIEGLPNADFIEVKGSGHVVNLDAPHTFNQYSLSFMKSKGAETTGPFEVNGTKIRL
ncbi:alpha/beta hydrolase [Halobacillus kuroshimensis]|uniref:Alpha/beta hydrolase n=1 Tax=Halobacillus kuroshimensis TaxID=302481 RepID=A0ABS3DV60_9BACI|nr:alpha/beta hydrolase [Halobacillus kuroshimensis]MBN8235231.1 alpha/beta hydrolase [Halobacillus kuroshimensis]